MASMEGDAVTDTSMSLRVKIASLIVHVQEMDPTTKGMAFDLPAAKALADDPEVVAWLATIDPAFLPEKRG